MKYFKLIRGYSSEDYIEIDETELDKAFYCFLEKKDAVYSGGAIRGSQIMAIQPDYHRIMGWNRGYKLQVDDYDELRSKSIDTDCRTMLEHSKAKVLHALKTGNFDTVGTKNDIQALPHTIKELNEAKSTVVKKFKIQ